jgi:hypothetical protein
LYIESRRAILGRKRLCKNGCGKADFTATEIVNEADQKKMDSRLKKYKLRGYNQPKRTPGHPRKSHIVLAKEGSRIKLIRFGKQGVMGVKNPKNAEEERRRNSFKARHAKNIAKGKMSAAYWSNKVKW